jgi:hypothetical protein
MSPPVAQVESNRSPGVFDEGDLLWVIVGGIIAELALAVLALSLAVSIRSLILPTLDIRRVGQGPGLLNH